MEFEVSEDIVPDIQTSVYVDITVDAENGIVTACAALPGVSESKTFGYSFTHPDDKFDADIGIELAGGRALQELGSKLVRRSNKEVNKRDKFRRSQKKASEAAIAARKEKSAKIKAEREAAVNLPPSYGAFKVGDRVRTVTKGGMSDWNMLTGTVTSPYGSLYIQVDLDNGERILFDKTELVHLQTREDLPA